MRNWRVNRAGGGALAAAPFGGVAAAGPEGEADQEAEIIPAAGIGRAVNADAVGEPRDDEGDWGDGAVENAPEETAGAFDGEWCCGTGGEQGEGCEGEKRAAGHERSVGDWAVVGQGAGSL